MIEWFSPAIVLVALLITSAHKDSRIIGGHEVDIITHPYLVSIRYREGTNSSYWHKCAGSIYSERVVITAAQCIINIAVSERVVIVAGANTRTGADGMPYPVLQSIAHSNFSFRNVDYDVGIMILEIAFDFKQTGVHPIDVFPKRPETGRVGTIAGWGYRKEYGPSSYYLEETEVPIVGEAECALVYGEGEITERMICAGFLHAGGKDACQGDTGGPLIVSGKLVGLVSWGRGCAQTGYPSVYTFIAALKQWIDETIAANVK